MKIPFINLEINKRGISFVDEKTQRIFTTEIVKKVIPVLPGRNVSALVESAVMNQKLKYLGYDAAKELTSKVAELTRRKREVE